MLSSFRFLVTPYLTQLGGEARLGFASAAMLLAAVVLLHSELALPHLPGGWRFRASWRLVRVVYYVLVGGFIFFLFSPLLAKMIQFD